LVNQNKSSAAGVMPAGSYAFAYRIEIRIQNAATFSGGSMIILTITPGGFLAAY
jgi:hypothetical protein